eukprot:gb/GECG01013739.1/.p1 GENE.gb/GECG01013739.1/~~gb/GECG01013739.1/.p1  ORF type:complete len:993 (+),score=197.97 gb/GECG01013739.1/:1-2979(+)
MEARIQQVQSVFEGSDGWISKHNDMIQLLSEFSEHLQNQAKDTDTLLADTADELQDASVEFRNVLNRFTLLGNSQFMENRVWEEDEEDLVGSGGQDNQSRSSTSTALVTVADDSDEDEEIPTALAMGHAESCREEALKQGKKALQRFEPYVKSHSHEAHSNRGPNMYSRPLPYIIGTSKFSLSRSVGLAYEDEEVNHPYHGMVGEGIDATSQQQHQPPPTTGPSTDMGSPETGSGTMFPEDQDDSRMNGDSIIAHGRQETSLTQYVDEIVPDDYDGAGSEGSRGRDEQGGIFGDPEEEDDDAPGAAIDFATNEASARFQEPSDNTGTTDRSTGHQTESEEDGEHSTGVAHTSGASHVHRTSSRRDRKEFAPQTSRASERRSTEEERSLRSDDEFRDPVLDGSSPTGFGDSGKIFGYEDESESDDEGPTGFGSTQPSPSTSTANEHASTGLEATLTEGANRPHEGSRQSAPQSQAARSNTTGIFGHDSDSSDEEEETKQSARPAAANTMAMQLFGGDSDSDSDSDDDDLLPSQSPQGRRNEENQGESTGDSSRTATSATSAPRLQTKATSSGVSGTGSNRVLDDELRKRIGTQRKLSSGSEDSNGSSDSEQESKQQPHRQSANAREPSRQSPGSEGLENAIPGANQADNGQDNVDNGAISSDQEDETGTNQGVRASLRGQGFGADIQSELQKRLSTRPHPSNSVGSAEDSDSDSDGPLPTTKQTETKQEPVTAAYSSNQSADETEEDVGEGGSRKGAAASSKVSQLGKKLAQEGFTAAKMTQPPQRKTQAEGSDESTSASAPSSQLDDPDMEMLQGDTSQQIRHTSRAKGPPRRRPKSSAVSRSAGQTNQNAASEDTSVMRSSDEQSRANTLTTAPADRTAGDDFGEKTGATAPIQAGGGSAVDENSKNSAPDDAADRIADEVSPDKRGGAAPRKARGGSAVDENSKNIADLFGGISDEGSSDDEGSAPMAAPKQQLQPSTYGSLFDDTDSDE